MADSNNNSWCVPVSPKQISASMLVTELHEFKENDLRATLELQEDIQVDGIVDLGSGRVLIHYQIDEGEKIDSISVGNKLCPVERQWVYRPGEPTIVCARGLNKAITSIILKKYLDMNHIQTNNIVFPQGEEGTVNIELAHPTDLPFLECGSHRIKRQIVEFFEASVIEQADIEDIEVADFPMASLQNLPSVDEGNEEITEELPNQPQPSSLFTQPDPSPRPLPNPPWPSEEAPSVLLIKDLPECPEELLKTQLECLFNNNGFTVVDGRIENGCAFYKFKEEDAVAKLIANPPDNSSLIGQTIKYTSATVSKSSPPPSTGPCVLVVDGVPSLPKVDETLKYYLKNVTKTLPLSCVVSGDQAIVKFSDHNIVRSLAKTPPTAPLIGRLLKFSIRPETPPTRPSPSSSDNRNTLKHQTSDPFSTLPVTAASDRSIIGTSSEQVTSSLPTTPSVQPPLPPPRKRSRSQSLIVGQIPMDYNLDHIKLHLESLSKVNCREVKMKNQTALVELDEPIYIDSLKSSLLKRGDSLTVDPIEPSTSVQITSEVSLDSISINFFCIRYCDEGVEIDRKSDHRFIVTFKTQQDLKKFESANHNNLINNKPITVSPYHPLLASFEEDNDPVPPLYDSVYDETPPPIPPREEEMPVYADVSPYSKQLNDSEGKFMMNRLSDLNKELIQICGEANIVGNVLKIQRKEIIPNWKEKVSEIVDKYLKDFVSQAIQCSSANKGKVLEYLHLHQQKHKDFHFVMNDNDYQIGGGHASVTEAMEHMNNMEEGDAEIVQEIRKPSHLVGYFMKFAQESIKVIHPPVTVNRSDSDPGLIIVEGMRESIDQVQELVKEKLSNLSVEHVLLTRKAHKLLNSNKGKEKLATTLGANLNTVHYSFEKIEDDDMFTHNVYIVSAIGPTLAVAKRKIESLCKEEKIILTQDKTDLLSKQNPKWDQIISRPDLFVSVRVIDDTIIITGDETDIRKMTHDIHRFMETQNEAEEEMSMETCVYQVIATNLKSKLERVVDEGKRNKVQVSLPLVDEDKPNVFIRFNGNSNYIGNIKVQLNHMEAEVLSKSFSIPPKPGVHKLSEKGLLRAKCLELGQSNKVIVRFNIESDHASNSPQYKQPSTNTHRIITASSPTGVHLAIYTGNYAQLKCDAFVTFIPDDPKFTEPVLVALSNFGGLEVQKDFEATLGARKLTQASLYSTKRTGNLECREIIHIVLPRYDLLFGARNPQMLLSQTLQHLFYGTTPKYNTMVICPPTLPPLNYPGDLYAKCLTDTIMNIKQGMYGTDLNLQVFVDDDYEVDEFEVAMKSSNYVIHSRDHVNTLPVFKPRPVKETGTPESLQKVVKILTGDMLDIQADVYINSTGPEMDFSTGTLAATFKAECGQPLLDEVKVFLSYETKLRYGKVAVTEAYNLKAKAIYHVALKGVDQPGYERSFRESVENIFLTAKDHGHQSIAIPCLGVVGLGYKPEMSARILFESVISFHHKYPNAINEFIFIVHRPCDKEAFYDEYETKVQQFTKSSASRHPTAPGNRDFGSLKVEIVLGNIADEVTQVIVNSTSSDMKSTNAISRAILKAAGDDMLYACTNLVECGVSCNNGNVVPTNASGVLRCDKVYHVHIPGKKERDVPPTHAESQVFKKVVRGCLDLAEDFQQESLSFPAFCLGIGQYTVEQSAGLMFEAFDEFVKTNPKYLSTIKVVILDKAKYDEFHEYYKQVSSNTANGLTSLATGGRMGSPPPLKSLSPPLNRASITKLSCQKTGVRFRLYGVHDQSINSIETELTRFINDSIVTDMVDLGDAIRLFHKDDFNKLMEIAVQSGVEFDIQFEFDRIIVIGEETAVEKICGKVQQKKNDLQKLAQELQVYQWFVEDVKQQGGLQLYQPDAMAQIEVAYKRDLPLVELMIDQTEVIVDLKKMEQYEPNGMSPRRKIIRKKKAAEVELPLEWEPHPCDSQGNTKLVHFVTLSEFSPEYALATQGFHKTLGNLKCSIHSVKRVQNPGEYSRYLSLKLSWESTLGQGVVKEREVFHGTKEESLVSICSQGFNRIFAADNNAAHFGKGVYFALNSWYSAQDKYASKTKSGHKHMLVCTLLVGNYTRGNKSMKIAPPIPDKSQVIYDTLVDKVDSPTIFVAMKDSQAYPKYWITFTKDN